MRRDTITLQGFLLGRFLHEGYVHTWEYPGWKKTENLIGGALGKEDGGGGVGIRMSWVEQFRVIN